MGVPKVIGASPSLEFTILNENSLASKAAGAIRTSRFPLDSVDNA